MKKEDFRVHNLSQDYRKQSKKNFELPDLIHSDRKFIAEKTRSIEEIIRSMVPNIKKFKLHQTQQDTFKLPQSLNRPSELRDFVESGEI